MNVRCYACWAVFVICSCGGDEATPTVAIQQLARVTDEPACYGVRGQASTAPVAPRGGCKAALANQVATFSGHVFALPSGQELDALQAEGTVAGDTSHGWAAPSPLAARQGLWLRDLVGTGPISGVVGVSELFVEYRAGALPLVDLRGQRVQLVRELIQFAGGEITVRATVLRTAGGQLLVASVHGTADEYFAERLPEIRTQQVGDRGAPIPRACSGSNGTITSVPVSLEVRSLAETKVVSGCSSGGLAIGCVEYVVASGRVEETTKMEIESPGCGIDPTLELDITRKGVLEPTP